LHPYSTIGKITVLYILYHRMALNYLYLEFPFTKESFEYINVAILLHRYHFCIFFSDYSTLACHNFQCHHILLFMYCVLFSLQLSGTESL